MRRPNRREARTAILQIPGGAGLFSSLCVLRWPVENLTASERRQRNTSALVSLGHDHRNEMVHKHILRNVRPINLTWINVMQPSRTHAKIGNRAAGPQQVRRPEDRSAC
jgi:hypothetical protein